MSDAEFGTMMASWTESAQGPPYVGGVDEMKRSGDKDEDPSGKFVVGGTDDRVEALE